MLTHYKTNGQLSEKELWWRVCRYWGGGGENKSVPQEGGGGWIEKIFDKIEDFTRGIHTFDF